ncbi:MAG: hypothetical protein WC308_03560 [archaeon]|jgi:hypothetical protein
MPKKRKLSNKNFFSGKARSEGFTHYDPKILSEERNPAHIVLKLIIVFVAGILFGLITMQAGIPRTQIFIYLEVALLVAIMALLLDVRRILLAL